MDDHSGNDDQNLEEISMIFAEFFDGETVSNHPDFPSDDEPVYYDADNNPYTFQELPEDELWN